MPFRVGEENSIERSMLIQRRVEGQELGKTLSQNAEQLIRSQSEESYIDFGDPAGDQTRYCIVMAADMATFENQDPDKAIESMREGFPIDIRAAFERQKYWYDQLEYARKHPVRVRFQMAWQSIRRFLRIA